MANRSLAAKHARATQQRIEAGQIEYWKPAYLAKPDMGTDALMSCVRDGYFKVTKLPMVKPKARKVSYSEPRQRSGLIANGGMMAHVSRGPDRLIKG